VCNDSPVFIGGQDVARAAIPATYRKQPKIDALRLYKEEILEAHR
jgi:hypothetical protein